MRNNIARLHRAIADGGDDAADKIEEAVYGPVGLYFNFLALYRDPADKGGYQALNVDIDPDIFENAHRALTKMRKKMGEAEPDFKPMELPQGTLWTLSEQQLKFYRLCQRSIQPARLRVVGRSNTPG